MGLNFATELSTTDTMPLEQQINIHLQYNFYPPIPSSMVQPCIDAINAYWNEDIYAEINFEVCDFGVERLMQELNESVLL